jgi:hypothetical protein
VTATQASTGSAARRPVATTASAVTSRLPVTYPANGPIPLSELPTIQTLSHQPISNETFVGVDARGTGRQTVERPRLEISAQRNAGGAVFLLDLGGLRCDALPLSVAIRIDVGPDIFSAAVLPVVCALLRVAYGDDSSIAENPNLDWSEFD